MADALSRKSYGEVELGSLIRTHEVNWALLDKEISEDEFLQQVKSELIRGEKDHKGFHVVNSRLMYKGRHVIPGTSVIRDQLLREYHNTPIGGHAGDVKTYLRIAAEWFWGGMRKDVANYVRQ